MWLAVWLTLFNALGSSAGFINPARLEVADNVPIGILEVSIAAAFFWAVFRGGSLQMLYPRVRQHPLIAWLLGLWIATWIVGTVGSLGGLAPLRSVLLAMRDYGAVPLCLFIGYRALSTPQSVQRMVWVIAIGAVGNALFLLLRFQSGSEHLETGSTNINALRQIDFMTSYSIIGCLLFSFSVLSGSRLVAPWLAICVSALCMVGACASISRTTLVGMALGFCMLCAIIPRGKRLWAAAKLLFIIPLGILAFWAGIHVASNLTHRDFAKVMDRQFQSLLPDTENNGVHYNKAWDTRLPSAKVETELFLSSPLFGHGFTSTTEFVLHGGPNYGAFGHNSWTALMGSTGVIGLSSMLLLVGALTLIGRRMVVDQVDRSSLFMGAIGFIVGINTLIFMFCTLMFTARGAMYYALICGLLIRAREIQETSLGQQSYGFEPLFEESQRLPAALVREGIW